MIAYLRMYLRIIYVVRARMRCELSARAKDKLRLTRQNLMYTKNQLGEPQNLEVVVVCDEDKSEKEEAEISTRFKSKVIINPRVVSVQVHMAIHTRMQVPGCTSEQQEESTHPKSNSDQDRKSVV